MGRPSVHTPRGISLLAHPSGPEAHSDGRLKQKSARFPRRKRRTSPGIHCRLDARYVRELELRLRRVERIAEVNRRLALTDPLTGLPNRRHLERYLDRVLARGVLGASHQTGSRLRPLSLVLFDVDDFKRFNDRHGYPEGDRVLAAVATVFSRASANVSRHQSRGFPYRPESGHRPRGRSDAIPDSPFAARLGGDEFVVIFADMRAGRVRAAAQRIARAVARHPSLSPHGVTVSFGLAALWRLAGRPCGSGPGSPSSSRGPPAPGGPGLSVPLGASARRARASPPPAEHRLPAAPRPISAMNATHPIPNELGDLARTAEGFARAAGEVALGYFGARIEVETKADDTPVTIADREAERLLRAEILRRYPDHGIVGEEHGEVQPGAPVRWILDPIDGTKSFVHGVPLWGVLIGIEVEGEPVVGGRPPPRAR